MRQSMRQGFRGATVTVIGVRQRQDHGHEFPFHPAGATVLAWAPGLASGPSRHRAWHRPRKREPRERRAYTIKPPVNITK